MLGLTGSTRRRHFVASSGFHLRRGLRQFQDALGELVQQCVVI